MDWFVYYFCINLLGMLHVAHANQKASQLEELAASVDSAITQLKQRPDFGQMGWQSVKELLVIEGHVIDCLSNNMSDVYFDYVLTTRESLLDRALPSVLELREKMIDTSTIYAAERAHVIGKLQAIDECNLIYTLSKKERKRFLKYMAEMLGIYYYRADRIQNSQ
jgi:hypothetical protein